MLAGFPGLPVSRTGASRVLPGNVDDEILFHELFHAYRGISGTRIMAGYDNTEEFLSVLVSNIYASETGRSVLRRDHHGFATLDPSLAEPGGFFGDTIAGRDNLGALVASGLEPQMFAALACSPARFNPFRDLVKAGCKNLFEAAQGLKKLTAYSPFSNGSTVSMTRSRR